MAAIERVIPLVSQLPAAIREALVREVPKVSMYRSHLALSYRYRGLARRGVHVRLYQAPALAV